MTNGVSQFIVELRTGHGTHDMRATQQAGDGDLSWAVTLRSRGYEGGELEGSGVCECVMTGSVVRWCVRWSGSQCGLRVYGQQKEGKNSSDPHPRIPSHSLSPHSHTFFFPPNFPTCTYLVVCGIVRCVVVCDAVRWYMYVVCDLFFVFTKSFPNRSATGTPPTQWGE
jgi:hypothetical protein